MNTFTLQAGQTRNYSMSGAYFLARRVGNGFYIAAPERSIAEGRTIVRRLCAFARAIKPPADKQI